MPVNVDHRVLGGKYVKSTQSELGTDRLRTKKDLERFYAVHKPTFKESVAFSITNKLNRVLNKIKRKRNNWNAIFNDFYLGVIPSKNDIPKIKRLAPDKQIHIFSIANNFELAAKARPKAWKKAGIKHTHLPMTDFASDMEISNILYIVKEMKKAHDEGEVVYIHCKAGKARSAMIVAVYLATYGAPPQLVFTNESPAIRLKRSIEFMKQKRSQVDLHHELLNDDEWTKLDELEKQDPEKAGKLGKLLKAFEAVKAMPEAKQYARPAVVLENVFHSLQFKNDFTKTDSFKNLQIYAMKTHSDEMRKLIEDFFKEILNSENSNWRSNLKDAMNYLRLHQEISKKEKSEIKNQWGIVGKIIGHPRFDIKMKNCLFELDKDLRVYLYEFANNAGLKISSTQKLQAARSTPVVPHKMSKSNEARAKEVKNEEKRQADLEEFRTLHQKINPNK